MHKKAICPVLLILSSLLLACGLVDLTPSVTSDESSVQTRIAGDVAATLTALPADIQPLPTATPVSAVQEVTQLPSPTGTPVPPPTDVPVPTLMPGYVVDEERVIGGYIVRLWRNTVDDALGFDNVATISSGGKTLVQIDWVFGLGDLTGTDVTGEGNPDAIIERFTGGAHCCFSTHVYDLGPTLTKVLETPESNCGGNFQDLDGDGVFEFVTCDDLFAYVYCAYAASPAVEVILQYEPGQDYVPASPRFAYLYTEMIADHTQMIEETDPSEFGDWDGTSKCLVLPLVLDYLYTGQAERAWEALNQYYDYPDRLLFWTEVVQAVAESTLYAPAGSQPAVEKPSYYMLQLLTNCGPDWQYVGFLQEGQSACDAQIPHRDIFWLDWRLREIGLLADGEWLELTPEGCTTNCRLDVVRSADSALLGSIRLDTTVGFPGAVYRVNGGESERWRMRGDLTWELASP